MSDFAQRLNQQIMKDNKLFYAEKWFQLQNIPTTIDDGRIYVSPNGHFELQLSRSEVEYRAELYLESELEGVRA